MYIKKQREGEMSSAERLKKAKEVFFEAMMHGYANPEAKKTSLKGLPKSKVITFEKDDFIVTDLYFTHPESDASSGITIIHHQNEPIWVMHYGGWYKKEAISFLKEVLYTAYKKEYFAGGRGINPSQSDSFLYLNRIERDSFSDFNGREEIYDGSGTLLGFHEYFGGSLLPK